MSPHAGMAAAVGLCGFLAGAVAGWAIAYYVFRRAKALAAAEMLGLPREERHAVRQSRGGAWESAGVPKGPRPPKR